MAKSPESGFTDAEVTANSDFIFADAAMHEVLLELCRNYKGIDPEIDAKIDAQAGFIAGDDRVTFIAPHNPNAPRVPLYLEGEPGQGKSSLVEAAGRRFCEITGLNFIFRPDDSYVIQPNDFYFSIVNLSGAQNKSDFGGMMIRTEAEIQQHVKVRRKAADTGSVVLDELVSRSKALAGFSKQLPGGGVELNITQYEIGTLDCVEIDFSGDDTMSQKISDALLSQMVDLSKSGGVGMTSLKSGADALDDRISYSTEKNDTGTKLSIFAPRVLDNRVEYASAILPSLQFAKFKKARFGLVNFDDVANANENIRNILLEVLQKGRYSGTMDMGKAYATMSGNQGAEDGTNVMSRMSDAELTRIRKLNVRDRPEDWAKRVTEKYTSEVGDCFFASFVHRQGNQEGIFREPPGKRGKRGERKTNGRALENALEVVSQHFIAAKHAGISVTEFRERIVRDVNDCAGARVAKAFDAHLVSMATEAIPLADDLINKAKFNVDKFNKHSELCRTTTGQDFCYRFASAIADSFVYKVAFGKLRDEKNIAVVMKQLEDTMEHASVGLAALVKNGQSSVMNYCLSQLSTKLMNIPRFSVEDKVGRKLSADVSKALSNGFARSITTKVWGTEANEKEAADNFVKAIAGSNVPSFSSPKAAV